MSFQKVFYLTILILLALLLKDSVGSRSSGRSGSSRSSRIGSSGSSWGSSGSSISRFSSGGTRWKSAAKGAAAAIIFTKMARTRFGFGGIGGIGGFGAYPHGHYGYYRRRYSHIQGDYCENYENFNGTTIGEFQCPLDDFNYNDVYCCGEDGYQYCCSFFDGSGRTAGVVVGIIVFMLLVALAIFCCCRFRQKLAGMGGRIPFFGKRSSSAGAGQAAIPLRTVTTPQRPAVYSAAPPPSCPVASGYPPYGNSPAAYPNSTLLGTYSTGAPPAPGFSQYSAPPAGGSYSTGASAPPPPPGFVIR